MNTPAHLIFAAAAFARPGQWRQTVAALAGGLAGSVAADPFEDFGTAMKYALPLAAATCAARDDRLEDFAVRGAVQMVLVGEESGKLDVMLLELAQVYEAEVEADVKRALTLLEPALILGMGGLIAIIIMGILMGILSVNTMAF